MAAPAGIAGQIGFKSESTYGTGVTVDQFHPGFRSETVEQQIARVESQGLRAGRRHHHKWKPGAVTIGGPVVLELWDEPAATLLTHMFGSVVTTGAGPYTHTATPGSLTSKSLTVQVGRPDQSGTVQPFTYTGCKIPSWSLTAAVGEIPLLELQLSAQAEDTGTALASASYPTAAPFVFTEASLTVAAAAMSVRSMSLNYVSTLAVDRHRLGAATVKEQLENGFREATGQVEADFESLTAYNRFVNGTEAALVQTFDNGTDSLVITCNVVFNGQTPTVDGPEQLDQPLPFKCVDADADSDAITAVLINGESSAA